MAKSKAPAAPAAKNDSGKNGGKTAPANGDNKPIRNLYLVDAADLMPEALKMAEHLLTLPPASRVNTVHMMRQMRPAPAPEQERLAAALQEHGAKSDLIESRAAFAEKRAPNFKGWDKPEDRYRLPTIESVKG